ncbi:uncharacterized protein LY89DRAFT_691671 [Mollisia scopiformis]|uniref:Uncharacterized protein n=1 Tax=Mollisia scopiformis TaxID=149040 RepID=A0A132B599_MOLSC|nr:uncharacterized protein LY89DRAFT_691671 [Mollisia scopiformis]KUJ07588.1 hypothetical protein LY89DRAFT_691671 [Mollisia scopiformis]
MDASTTMLAHSPATTGTLMATSAAVSNNLTVGQIIFHEFINIHERFRLPEFWNDMGIIFTFFLGCAILLYLIGISITFILMVLFPRAFGTYEPFQTELISDEALMNQVYGGPMYVDPEVERILQRVRERRARRKEGMPPGQHVGDIPLREFTKSQLKEQTFTGQNHHNEDGEEGLHSLRLE